MPFCPECEAEYESDVETCTDCGVSLVGELTDDAVEHDVEDWDAAPFLNFSNGAEAKMVEQLLRDNGVKAYVSGGDFTVAPSLFANEIVLMVDEEDAERAKTLYDAYFGEEATAAESTAEDSEGDGQ